MGGPTGLEPATCRCFQLVRPVPPGIRSIGPWELRPIATATTGLDNWQMTVHPDVTATGCCMSADVDKVTCNGNGTFTVTTTVKNTSSHPTQSVLVAPPPGATYTVTPNVIAAPLNNEQSTSITVTVSGAASNQTICLDFFLQDAAGGMCCTVKRCFTLPACACLEVLNAVLGCVPDSQGYPYTFTLHNLSTTAIQQVFAIPSTGSISPQLVAVNIPGGGSVPITLHLSGVHSGDHVCIVLQAYWDNPTECCTVRVCVTIPDPCSQDRQQGLAEENGPRLIPCWARWQSLFLRPRRTGSRGFRRRSPRSPART